MAGLVGPNGAGKTTLLHLAVGLLAPTTGTITVLGGEPTSGPAQLAKVGFVAQDTPVYGGLSVADHLRLGAHLNPGWDAGYAQYRLDRLAFDPAQRAGKLSGGQRAQLALALTLAIAKRPQLLILDEPVASLDPLARREFLQDLMEAVAEQGLSVIRSPARPARRCSARSRRPASRGRGRGGASSPAPPRSRRRTSSRSVTYQPADRYWTFQWLETGIFLTVAILLAWGCFWWVRRRLS